MTEIEPEKKDVSIAIACYNQAHFLDEAIQSALAQTHLASEILIVDDGSTDNTASVASQYPVLLIRQEHRGLSAARNAALHAVKTAFIVFLDADDRLRPNALKSGLACFRKHPESAFVYGGYCRINATGEAISPVVLPAKGYLDRDAYEYLLSGNHIGMHAAVMFHCSDLVAVGAFDLELPACEDYEIYLRIARFKPIAGHQTFIAEYRLHTSNMSSSGTLMLPTVLSVLDKQREWVGRDAHRLRALRNGLRSVQRFYGLLIFQEIASLVVQGRFAESGRAGKILARCDLLGLPWLAARWARHATMTLLPEPLRQKLRYWKKSYLRGNFFGRVGFGDLRRLEPFCRDFGFSRGTPVDRVYIENFLEAQAHHIRGQVLEVGGDDYTQRFGSGVKSCDVLHVHSGNPAATIIGDSTDAPQIPDDSFDCIILIQVLHLIHDTQGAIRTLWRILKPGGVVLATTPGISQVSRDEWAETWYRALTEQSLQREFLENGFGSDVLVEVQGNVLTSVSPLPGIVAEELTPQEFSLYDPQYPMIVCVRATKQVDC